MKQAILWGSLILAALVALIYSLATKPQASSVKETGLPPQNIPIYRYLLGEEVLVGYTSPVSIFISPPPCWFWRIQAPEGTRVCWDQDGECGDALKWWGTKYGWAHFYGPAGKKVRVYAESPKLYGKEGIDRYKECMGW